MRKFILVFYFFTMFSISYAQNEFFTANGDIEFKSLSFSPVSINCNYFRCDLFEEIFMQLESEFVISKVSDEQIVQLFKKLYSEITGKPSANFLNNRQYKEILKLAQLKGHIDSVQFYILVGILDDYLRGRKINETYELYSYYQNLKSTQRMSGHKNKADNFKSLNSSFYRKRVEALKDFTPRQRLYFLYTPLQIKVMAQIISESLEAMLAYQGRVQIDYNGDNIWDRTEQLTVQEIYRLGIKLLHRDYTRLSKNSLFSNNNVQIIDLISAALEFGVVDDEVIGEILKIDSLNIIQKGFFARHSSTFKSLGKLGVMATVNQGVFIVMAITLVESIAQNKRKYETYSPDTLF